MSMMILMLVMKIMIMPIVTIVVECRSQIEWYDVVS